MKWVIALLSFWAAISCAQDTITVRTNVYAVSGATLREIRADMEAKKPWKHKSDGYTQCKTNWRYETTPTDSGCVIQWLTISTDITITVPALAASASKAEALQSRWNVYLKALLEHENGHREIGVEAAAAVRRKLSELGPSSTCGELARTIKREAEKVLSQFQQRHEEYDKKTDNGRLQGAVFP